VRPFEEIVEEHGPVVLRVCRALLRPVDADDAWSETFISALRAYPDLRPDSNVRGWLVTIAHRKAIDVLRKQQRLPRPSEEVVVAEAPLEGVSDDLSDALARLPDKQRASVILHYLAGLPYAEVGAEIGTTADAARRNAADGIAALRRTYRSGSGGADRRGGGTRSDPCEAKGSAR
jgi:RNA polymerase sigma factor (sigma-70 family)